MGHAHATSACCAIKQNCPTIVRFPSFLTRHRKLQGVSALLPPCSLVISVETLGLVLAADAFTTRQGSSSAETPWSLRCLVKKDGKRTIVGQFCFIAQQALVACAWL